VDLQSGFLKTFTWNDCLHTAPLFFGFPRCIRILFVFVHIDKNHGY